MSTGTDKIREALDCIVADVLDESGQRRASIPVNTFQKVMAALAELDKAQQPAEPVGYTNKEELATAASGAIAGGAFWLHSSGSTNIPLYAHPPQSQQPGKVLTGKCYICGKQTDNGQGIEGSIRSSDEQGGSVA